MKYDLIIGIDPGKGGGISTLYEGVAKAFKMPYSHQEMKDFFKYLNGVSENSICFLEKVQLRPDDMQGGKAFQIQKMLNHFQQLRTMLFVSEIKYVMVHPRTWQKSLNLLSIKNESKNDRKNRYKLSAKNRFKMLKVTLKNCDALLLLSYGFFILKTEPEKVENTLRISRDNNLFDNSI